MMNRVLLAHATHVRSNGSAIQLNSEYVILPREFKSYSIFCVTRSWFVTPMSVSLMYVTHVILWCLITVRDNYATPPGYSLLQRPTMSSRRRSVPIPTFYLIWCCRTRRLHNIHTWYNFAKNRPNITDKPRQGWVNDGLRSTHCICKEAFFVIWNFQ